MRIEMLHAASKKLDLTEEQQASLKKVHEAVGPKVEAIVKKMWREILGEEKMKEVMEVSKKAKEAGKTPRQTAAAVEAF